MGHEKLIRMDDKWESKSNNWGIGLEHSVENGIINGLIEDWDCGKVHDKW